MEEFHLAVYDGVDIILNILRIGGNNRAVIVIVSLLKFISLIGNTGVENTVYSLINQPLYMAVGQLGRIALRLTGNRFNPQLINLAGEAGDSTTWKPRVWKNVNQKG